MMYDSKQTFVDMFLEPHNNLKEIHFSLSSRNIFN